MPGVGGEHDGDQRAADAPVANECGGPGSCTKMFCFSCSAAELSDTGGSELGEDPGDATGDAAGGGAAGSANHAGGAAHDLAAAAATAAAASGHGGRSADGSPELHTRPRTVGEPGCPSPAAPANGEGVESPEVHALGRAGDAGRADPGDHAAAGHSRAAEAEAEAEGGASPELHCTLPPGSAP